MRRRRGGHSLALQRGHPGRGGGDGVGEQGPAPPRGAVKTLPRSPAPACDALFF